MKSIRYLSIYLTLTIGSFFLIKENLSSKRITSINTPTSTSLESTQKHEQASYLSSTTNTLIAPGDACTGIASNAIGGTVWEDWNYNGVQDENTLIGVEGIIVSIIDDCNNTLNSIETDADGDFLFSNLNTSLTYRIEFTIPDALQWAKPTFVGADNGTSIQFTSSGHCINLGVASPANYCDDNPLLAVPCYVNGDPTIGGTSANEDWFVYFRNNNQGEIGSGAYTAPTTKVEGDIIGATWGTAYHRETKTVLASAVMKRHSGFGQNGTGAIYQIDDLGTPSLWVDLNNYTNINTGTDTRNGSTNNILPGDFDVASRDINAFQAVGKVGIGDIDFSDDEKELYAINLNERSLVVLNVGNTLTAPTSASTYDIGTAIAALYTGTSAACGNASDYRPWALKYNKGKLYIGVICSAELSRNSNDVHAYVLSFDPTQPQNGFSKVIDMPMNYDREPAFQSDVSSQTISGIWRYWATNYTDATILSWRGGAHPSPILADIEIDDDGSMILGFMDRFGMQSGYRQLTTDLSDSSTDHQGMSAGDVIRYCKINGNLVREGGTGCAYNTSPPWTSPGDFVPKGEFYANEEFFTTITDPNHGHPETSLGGLALLSGSGELVAGVIDPFALRSGGIAWWDNTNGGLNKEYELYESVNSSTADGSFSKAVGLGDLQFMCASAPLQIGNYIWIDSDEDGIQDACETPMSGVAVSLYKNGTKIAETTSNATGQYYFSDNTANDPNLTWYGTNADTALLPNTAYQIAFGENQYSNNSLVINATSYLLTDAFQGSKTSIDSDAKEFNINGIIYPTISANTGDAGCVDHSFDVGFKPTSCPTLALMATDTICSNNTTTLALNYSDFAGNVALYYNTGTRLDSIALYAAGNGGATFIDSTHNQVIINELSYVTGDTIELWNQGSNTVDISNWYLCAGFAYDRFNTTTVINGSLQLGANQKVVLTDFPNINLGNSSEAMAIYNTNSFGSAAAMEDFIQWGAGGQARENVAVTKGIWTAGDFIPAIASEFTLSYDGQGDTSTDWGAQTATFCTDNGNLTSSFINNFTSPNFTNNTTAPITYYIYAILTENNDHINTHCMPIAIDSVVVTSIQINNLTTICDDNNTGGIETDDTFIIQLTATSPKNNSLQFEVLYNGTVLNTGGTNYNELASLSHPDFQATGNGTFTLIVRDKDELGCNTVIEVNTPSNCSNCPPLICAPIAVTKLLGS